MNYGVEEIINLLHNNPPATVAEHLRRHADYPSPSLRILAAIMDVRQTHSAELAAGTPFMALFVRHTAGSGKLPPSGLGDTIALITRATGLDRLAHLYTRVTGKDCGCRRRQTKLNARFPYRR